MDFEKIKEIMVNTLTLFLTLYQFLKTDENSFENKKEHI